MLIEIFAAHHPEIRQQFRKTTEETEGNILGKTASNIYYCHNYSSPLHKDKDIGLSSCIQLKKTGLQEDEWNFAYAEWGFYIVTEPNTAWYVLIILNI